MVFDNDNQVFSFLCANEDVSLFKKLGYSEKGRALMYVPPSADIVFFDIEQKGWRRVTDNLERLINEANNSKLKYKVSPFYGLSFSDVYDYAFGYVEGAGGKSGYYLLNHSNQTARRLGNESDWNAIVDLLDRQSIGVMLLPVAESHP